MNRVCSIHNEYCPDGNCRWCEAPVITAEPAVVAFSYMGVRVVVDPNLKADELRFADNGNWPPGGVTGSPL